jgi:subtilisin family serine protease
MPVKVTAGGSAYDSNLAAGVVWAVDHGARVVNLSFAGTSSSTTLKNAVAYARGNGAVVVAAAGNSGCDCVTYPAGYPGVIAVAASSNLTGDVLQGYSNYGSWVDVAAPSGNVTTTLTDPSTGAQWGWMPVGGTSLAAPVVVGIAGLLLSAQPATTGPALEQALVTGADPVSGAHAVATGRIDAVDALAALGPAGPSPTPTATASPTPTASPTATPSPSPTTQVTTYSGSLTRKNTARSYPASASSTIRTATSFGCPSLSVAVTRPDGSAVSTASGPSVLATSAVVASGSLTVTVSGSTKCSFTVTVTSS